MRKIDYEIDRDFTYVDDIVEKMVRLVGNAPGATYGVVGDADEVAPHRVYNIGNNSLEKLMTFITALEKTLSDALGIEVVFEKNFEPLKPGDVPATYASTDLLQEAVGFKTVTSIEEGLRNRLIAGLRAKNAELQKECEFLSGRLFLVMHK